jgi:hypothetical protein
LTFTRASDATRTNSAGVIERTPWNLLTFSEDFSNAAWTKTAGITVVPNSITAPNGTLTADTFTSVDTFPRVVQNATIQANQSYRISVYAKAGSAYIFSTFVSVNSVSLVSVTFNLSTGIVTGSGTMQAVGGGWYLCSTTFTVGASTAIPDIRFFNHSQGVTGGWSVNNFIYGWGAQLVEGTDAKPYFATTNRQDVPRLDYRNADGSVSTCPRLLLEPQRTNLVLQSESFDNASWVKNNSTATANSTTSPDGTTNADTLITTNSLNFHRIYQNTTISALTNYTYTIFAKQNSSSLIQIALNTGFASLASLSPYANFNLSTGVVSQSGNGATASIQSVGNGWYRCVITATSVIGASTGEINIVQINSTTAPPFQSWQGTGAESVFIYGAQLEAGAYPTTYIPTTTAAVTRIADAASKTGVSSLIGQTEGTVFFDANFDDNNTVNFSISDGTSSNYILIDTTSLRAVGLIIQQGGVTQAQLTTANSFYTSGTRLKCAIAYKQNDFAFYINGTLIGTDSSGTVPACDQIRFSRWNGALPAAQGIAQSALFKTRLTNAQLAQLTTL